jgi:hypothetical protein
MYIWGYFWLDLVAMGDRLASWTPDPPVQFAIVNGTRGGGSKSPPPERGGVPKPPPERLWVSTTFDGVCRIWKCSEPVPPRELSDPYSIGNLVRNSFTGEPNEQSVTTRSACTRTRRDAWDRSQLVPLLHSGCQYLGLALHSASGHDVCGNCRFWSLYSSFACLGSPSATQVSVVLCHPSRLCWYSHPHERSGSQKDQFISGSLEFWSCLCGEISKFFTPSHQTEGQK